MAKIYAELTSDKNSKVVSKSGDNQLFIKLTLSNRILADITVLPSGTIVIDRGEDADVIVNKGTTHSA